jgi:hypothetical protein
MKYLLTFATLALCCLEAAPKKTDTPPPAPNQADDSDLFRKNAQVISLHGEFLFWRVQEGGLDYALAMQRPAWGPTLNYAQGNYVTQTWNGDPGFRLAIGLFRASRLWEMKAEYTRYTGHGESHANAPNVAQQYLVGTWPQIIPQLSYVKSNIHMNYNVADYFINRFFNPNPHLRLRLYGAGTVAWINQNWTIHYSDALQHTTSTRNHWAFNGGGIKTGMMVDWYWDFFDLYTTMKVMVGGLVGTYENNTKQKTNYPQADSNPDVAFRDSNYNDVRAVFTFQMLIGPSWQRNFPSNRLEIFAGYEVNGWLNMHEVYRSSGGSPTASKETYVNSSMLALQGLTVRVTYDF